MLAPDDLVVQAQPEQRLGLAARVAELLVELGGPTEQAQLVGVVGAVAQEAGVQDPTPGQRQVGLDPVELPLGQWEPFGLAAEDRPLVRLPRVLQSCIHTRHPIGLIIAR